MAATGSRALEDSGTIGKGVEALAAAVGKLSGDLPIILRLFSADLRDEGHLDHALRLAIGEVATNSGELVDLARRLTCSLRRGSRTATWRGCCRARRRSTRGGSEIGRAHV